MKEFAKLEEINIELCYGLPYRADLAPVEDIYNRAKSMYRSQVDRFKALNKKWDQLGLVQNIFDTITTDFYKHQASRLFRLIANA